MKQDTQTFLVPQSGRADERFCKSLRDIGDWVQLGLLRQDGPKRHAVFEDVDTLHYLSCSLLDGKGKDDPALLVIELSFDGTARDCLRELLEKKRSVMDAILACCAEFPGATASPDAVIAWLEPFGRRSDAVYIGTPGRSVTQIREEQGLRSALLKALEEDSVSLDRSALSRKERWETAVAKVRASHPSYPPVRPRPRRVRFNWAASPAVRTRIRQAVRLQLIAALWLAGVYAAFELLREPARETWHWLAVLGVPVAIAVISAGLMLLNAPRGLTRRAQLGVVRHALGDFLGTIVWLVPLGGLVVAAYETNWERREVVTALLWGGSVLLAVLQILVVAGFLYVARSARAAAVGALLTLGLLLWLFSVPSEQIEQVFAKVALLYAVTVAFVGLQIWRFTRALRRREAEHEHWDEDEELEHLDSVTSREYQQLHSHLVSETRIVEGRMGTLQGVLRVVQFFATWFFNLGHLATIPSIHFARFMVIPERKSLLFFSNYDDRFDTYLGDFSDVPGVTAVWGNTHQFPQPFLLVLDGARQENLFKRFARASQRESLIWYSAYPNLSVGEIDQATRLREAMDRKPDDGRTGFLADLRRWWRPTLDEAALDALMEGR